VRDAAVRFAPRISGTPLRAKSTKSVSELRSQAILDHRVDTAGAAIFLIDRVEEPNLATDVLPRDLLAVTVQL
jgi:hypothetical protein